MRHCQLNENNKLGSLKSARHGCGTAPAGNSSSRRSLRVCRITRSVHHVGETSPKVFDCLSSAPASTPSNTTGTRPFLTRSYSASKLAMVVRSPSETCPQMSLSGVTARRLFNSVSIYIKHPLAIDGNAIPSQHCSLQRWNHFRILRRTSAQYFFLTSAWRTSSSGITSAFSRERNASAQYFFLTSAWRLKTDDIQSAFSHVVPV